MVTKYFNIFVWSTVIALGLMGVFDLVFFVFGGAGQTLSFQFWKLAKAYPFVPFILGFLCGHLVWQYDPDDIKAFKAKVLSKLSGTPQNEA